MPHEHAASSASFRCAPSTALTGKRRRDDPAIGGQRMKPSSVAQARPPPVRQDHAAPPAETRSQALYRRHGLGFEFVGKLIELVEIDPGPEAEGLGNGFWGRIPARLRLLAKTGAQRWVDDLLEWQPQFSSPSPQRPGQIVNDGVLRWVFCARKAAWMRLASMSTHQRSSRVARRIALPPRWNAGQAGCRSAARSRGGAGRGPRRAALVSVLAQRPRLNYHHPL